MVSVGHSLLELSLKPGCAMMLWPDRSALILTLLLLRICLFSVTSSEELDASNDLFRQLQISDFDASADDNFFDLNSNSELLATATSDDLLVADLFVDSDNLFGPDDSRARDDSIDQELMLISNDECSFDAASIDTEGFLDIIEKRESGQTCKTREQGSTSGKPSKRPGDSKSFLDNLPIFEPHQDFQPHEDLEFCKPILVRDRNVPLCLIGISELALATSGQYFPEDQLAGCAPCMSLPLLLVI